MPDSSVLPGPAKRVYEALDAERWSTAMALVDKLGMAETEIVRQLRQLEDAGWVETGFVPEGSPSGAAAVGYRKKAR